MKIRLLIWILVVVLFYFYLNLFKNALIDDVFITMSYVKTILSSGTWGFFPGYITNTASSPLNVMLLVLIGLLSVLTIETPILLALVCLFTMTYLLTRISKHLFGEEQFGYLAAVAFIFNPLVISTIGLESILFATVFVTAIYFYIISKWDLLAVALGLLAITRADGFLVFLVFLIAVPKPQLRFRFISIYLLCIAPWYIFSWIYLGSFIPDTFFIKKMAASWAQWDFFNGVILYYQRYPLETILSLAFLPLLLLYVNKEARKSPIILIIALLGLTHFVGYSLLEVPPYHWYYVPEVTTIILLGSLGLGYVYKDSQSKPKHRRVLQVFTLIFLLVPALGMFQFLNKEHFFIKEMPIHTNWATYEQYKNAGVSISKTTAGKTVLHRGEIGTLAFYCDCYLLEKFSDRRWMKEIIDSNSVGRGLSSIVFRLNFHFLNINQDYPPYSYVISVYPAANLGDSVENAQKWETSTKWIPQGIITFESIK